MRASRRSPARTLGRAWAGRRTFGLLLLSGHLRFNQAAVGSLAERVTITEADVDFYAREFKRTGFPGALNYYRNLDRNREIQGALAGAEVNVPALYIELWR